MAKKKQNKPVNGTTTEKKTVERKPTKKEKKAAAEQRSRELKAKRQKFYAVALVFAVLAVVISFASSSTYGQAIYSWIQIGCYGLMGLCGVVVLYASRYEETEKKQRSRNSMGMVFIMVALGIILAEIVKMVTGK